MFHVPVEDVLVIVMERILSACQDANLTDELKQAEQTLQEIYQWFAQELQIEEKKVESGSQAEGGVDASESYLGKVLGLLVSMKGYIR